MMSCASILSGRVCSSSSSSEYIFRSQCSVVCVRGVIVIKSESKNTHSCVWKSNWIISLTLISHTLHASRYFSRESNLVHTHCTCVTMTPSRLRHTFSIWLVVLSFDRLSWDTQSDSSSYHSFAFVVLSFFRLSRPPSHRSLWVSWSSSQTDCLLDSSLEYILSCVTDDWETPSWPWESRHRPPRDILV